MILALAVHYGSITFCVACAAAVDIRHGHGWGWFLVLGGVCVLTRVEISGNG